MQRNGHFNERVRFLTCMSQCLLTLQSLLLRDGEEDPTLSPPTDALAERRISGSDSPAALGEFLATSTKFGEPLLRCGEERSTWSGIGRAAVSPLAVCGMPLACERVSPAVIGMPPAADGKGGRLACVLTLADCVVCECCWCCCWRPVMWCSCRLLMVLWCSCRLLLLLWCSCRLLLLLQCSCLKEDDWESTDWDCEDVLSALLSERVNGTFQIFDKTLTMHGEDKTCCNEGNTLSQQLKDYFVQDFERLNFRKRKLNTASTDTVILNL